MTESRKNAITFAHQNQDRFLRELVEFIAIPSISTEPERKQDMLRAAQWVAERLRRIGIERVEIFPTQGHPIVFGESKQAGAGAKTILIYGHYDVQPAEPLELWDSPAFEADQRGDDLFGRGSSDMKGQVIAAFAAVEAAMRAGKLPVNVKFLIEGEEEVGSPNLDEFIANNKALLACDMAFNPDTGMLGAEHPTITYALRGMAYFELRIYGPSHDLHSGLYGGVVHNPAQALCELVAGMHDADGRVTLPGFYETVLPLDDQERQELKRLPTDEAFYLEQTGAAKLWGEAGYTPSERVGARPTLEVNGLYSGFTGEGSKTVLPAWAMAKISCRLVPNQDPNQVHEQLTAYLKANAPDSVRWELKNLVGGYPSISDRSSDGVRAVAKAMEQVWGKPTLFRREGGSVPVVAQFQKYLGIESVNFGFGLPDDNAHGPNEKLHVPTWLRGIDAFIHAFYNLAEPTHAPTPIPSPRSGGGE